MYLCSHKINSNEQNILLEMRSCSCFHNGHGTWADVLILLAQRFYERLQVQSIRNLFYIISLRNKDLTLINSNRFLKIA